MESNSESDGEGLICLVSFLIRLFAVVRYESVFLCFIFHLGYS